VYTRICFRIDSYRTYYRSTIATAFMGWPPITRVRSLLSVIFVLNVIIFVRCIAVRCVSAAIVGSDDKHPCVTGRVRNCIVIVARKCSLLHVFKFFPVMQGRPEDENQEGGELIIRKIPIKIFLLNVSSIINYL
jgi:hypothetical protein